MPGWAVALLISGGTLLEVGLVYLLLRATIGSSFGKLAKAFPLQEPSPSAVRRNFQSFRFGLVNAGFSVHVVVDEDHLHLLPAAILRWCGARGTSVPWAEVEVRGKAGSFRRAKVGGVDMYGPRWCLDLASPPQV